MSSLVTQMVVAERYGVRLTVEQLAEVLGLKAGTVRNQISRGTCAVPTYEEGGRRWADFRDVAAHFDAARKRAA